jgi:hypothetical protein
MLYINFMNWYTMGKETPHMKRLFLVLAAFWLSVAPTMADTITTVSIGNYTWDVTKSTSLSIDVNVSGTSQISQAGIYLAVGDGGPSWGGTEQIQIGAVMPGAIWSGQSSQLSLGSQDAVVNANFNIPLVGSTQPSVLANGTLVTVTLLAPSGGLASEIGHQLVLNPNYGGPDPADPWFSTGFAFGSSTVTLQFVPGTLTLVPEPSMAMILLSLGGALCGWRCYRSKK